MFYFCICLFLFTFVYLAKMNNSNKNTSEGDQNDQERIFVRQEIVTSSLKQLPGTHHAKNKDHSNISSSSVIFKRISSVSSHSFVHTVSVIFSQQLVININKHFRGSIYVWFLVRAS